MTEYIPIAYFCKMLPISFGVKSIIPLFCSRRRPVSHDISVETGILSTKTLASIYHSVLKKEVYIPIIYPHMHACKCNLYNYFFPRECLQYLI